MIQLFLKEGVSWAEIAIATKVFLVFGIFLKLMILLTASIRKGPLKGLIYVWGGVMIVGSLMHFLSILISGGSPTTYYSLFKLVLLALGLAIVLPASHAIRDAPMIGRV